jgi:hypothetical protein
MQQKGYHKNWTSNSKVVNLPRNVVWKPNVESAQALTDIKQAIIDFNATLATGSTKVTLDRCLVLNSTPWQAIYGTPV